ncbi:hypothetical protein IT407_01215 [Candidatus Uhrbacteria bacterium]|nr:hypothetical protein [Candidatus Uhrbacteria bacterium]
MFTLVFVGCSSTGPVHMTEVECRLNSDCSVGEYCDTFASLCGWDCRSDDECAPGMYCDATNGRCLREETPPPPPDESPVLEIVAGDQSDLVLVGGANAAELYRFTLRNNGDRPIEVSNVHIGATTTSAYTLRVLGLAIIRDERSIDTVAGPIDLTPDDEVYAFGQRFEYAFIVPPHGELPLAVRSDLLDGERAEFDLFVGFADDLLDVLRYADTGEEVADEDVVGNHYIVRHVIVRPDHPGALSIVMEESGGRQLIDAGTESAISLFRILVENDTDETVYLSDLRIRVTADDGRPWMTDGVVALGSIDVHSSYDRSWLTAPPGASGCGGLGCTFVFDGTALPPGESTVLEVYVRINTPGRTLFMAVGESFTMFPGSTDAGSIFHRIATASGDLLPADQVVGNQAGFFYVASR